MRGMRGLGWWAVGLWALCGAGCGAGEPQGPELAPSATSGGSAPEADGSDSLQGADATDAPDVVRLRAPVAEDRPTSGPADALVTIVVISDFQCPFCARAAATLQEVKRSYGDDVRIVWRNYPLPFHPQAEPAAHAAMEAHARGGDDMFWRMHDLIFSEQSKLSRGLLVDLGQRVGMDPDAVARAMDERTHRTLVAEDVALADRLGLRGTPAFLVNGRRLMGAQPYEVFARLVEDELARTRSLVERGLPRSEVYAHLMKGARRDAAERGPEAPSPEPLERHEVPVPPDAPRRGPADAPVVIQVFSDFECPFCARAVPTLRQLLDEYGSEVTVVFRHYPLPFHRQARLAHQAAAEVHRQGGNPKFWAFHDLLFESGELTREDLEQHASQVGDLDLEALRRALDRGAHDTIIQADMDAADAMGTRIGTPAFLVNGLLVQGARSLALFRKIIDAELADR